MASVQEESKDELVLKEKIEPIAVERSEKHQLMAIYR
jgi:hypothetical protein